MEFNPNETPVEITKERFKIFSNILETFIQVLMNNDA